MGNEPGGGEGRGGGLKTNGLENVKGETRKKKGLIIERRVSLPSCSFLETVRKIYSYY